VDPSPGATITITITPASATVTQGQSADVSYSATTGGDFSGVVSIAASGLPTGVTATPDTPVVAGNITSGTVTIDVGAATAPGAYTITLTVSGSGVSAAATHALTVEETPALGLSVSPDPVFVDQGDAGATLVTLARTNFTDGVTLSVENVPVGVGFSSDPDPATGNDAVLTLTVDGAVATGDYALTLRGTSASLPDVTTPFTLTVDVAGGFSFSSIGALTLAPGTSADRDVTINRTGSFAGDVTVSVEGLPTGLTTSVAPVPASGATATITFTATAGLATAVYPVTVRGTAAGEPDEVVTMDVDVSTGPPGTDLVLDFSTCAPADRPMWFAFNNEGGPWEEVVGANDQYGFRAGANEFGVSFVTSPQLGDFAVSTVYLTVAEFQAQNVDLCEDDPAGLKTVTGTVANLVGLTTLTLGDAVASPFIDGPFSLAGVQSGALNLVGYSEDFVGSADRMVILRGQDIADGGDIGTIDFTAAGFAPDAATITIGGLVGGEVLFGGSSFATMAGGVCYTAGLTMAGSVSPFTAMGAPNAQMQTGEQNVVVMSATLASGMRRVEEAIGTMQDATVDLGPDLPPPTVNDISGAANYLRVEAEFALPVEYDASISFAYVAGNRFGFTTATNGARSGTVKLAVPDFSGVSGWDDTWAPPVSATGVSLISVASGATGPNPSCSPGGRLITATLTQTFN
jgi:hypothetical protein